MSIPQVAEGAVESKADLVAFLERGCRPPAEWRIGTEHEKFGFLLADHAPMPFEGAHGIARFLTEFARRFGWDPVMEGDRIIGLRCPQDNGSISLEPGGQLELSGAPLETLHQTCHEVNTHLDEVRTVAADIGVGFLGLGFSPKWTRDETPHMPKGRYAIMASYMPKVGGHGLDMMYRTCTVQVNLDYGSEADFVQKLRVALALQPVATALFASSPFFEGKSNGHRSWRSRIWRSLDASRTGMLPFAFDPGMGFQAYVDWVLDAPMYFVYRDGRYLDALGQSFRDFLKGQLPALPGEKPTLSDWADHMTTVFPEARAKKFIEMRGADCGDRAHIAALPAFWVGLMYDQTALDAAWDLVKGLDAETREALRVAASVSALQGQAGGVKLLDLARAAVGLSHAGLVARGLGEEAQLRPLVESLQTGTVQADKWLDLYNGAWGRSLTPLYEAASL